MTALPRWFTSSRLPGIRRVVTPGETEQLLKYLNILSKWQHVHRMVGSTEPAWIIENVFLDSVCFLEALPSEAIRIADLGSGAGIPGIPLAIVRRDLQVSLIEARQRRASFLSTVVRELALAHVTVLPSRAEEVASDLHGSFDAVVMRCAGTAKLTLGPAMTLARAGGVIVVSANPDISPAAGGEVVTVTTPSRTFRTFHRYVTPDATESELGH